MFFQSLLPQFKPFAPEKCRRKKAMAENLCMQRTASRFCSRQKRPGYTEILRKMGMGRFLQTAVSAVLFALLMLVPDATANQERQKPGKKDPAVEIHHVFPDGLFFFSRFLPFLIRGCVGKKRKARPERRDEFRR